MLRGDTDFALTPASTEWADRVDFVLGTDSNAALLARAEALDEQAWQRLTRPAPYANRIGRTRTRRRKKCWHACRVVTL